MPSIVDESLVRKVCVDDFALRKRFSYGTVMVDFETHRIIDIIPSRDGSSTYASASTDSHPDAIQVSDRFHVIKGLSEAINKYIIRVLSARLEIPLTELLEILSATNVGNYIQIELQLRALLNSSKCVYIVKKKI